MGTRETVSYFLKHHLDFIFRIVDRNHWAIGIFSQEMKNLIDNIEGETSFPKLFELNK